MIAVVGGATAGAETAGLLADRGVTVVVFDQNVRPYGKIEDGLPRWHVKLREKEYATVDRRLDRPEIHFVPCTNIGRDIDFRELATAWGFTAVILAVGAWRDRPLPVPGAERYVDRGLIYQNSFIHWFNHYEEPGYAGPRYAVEDGAVVVGGGLASIDVIKVVQLETVRAALARRGIQEDLLRLESVGIEAALQEHGLTWGALGLQGATLFYRRRIEDMPLLEVPEGADAARREQCEATRRRIIEKAMRKFCFRVRPQCAPAALLAEGDRLVGVRFQRMEVADGRLVPVAEGVEDVRAPLVLSSIGSIPAPIPGIPEDGELYAYSDRALGRIAGYEAVFGAGNAVTGKGNIVASRKHSVQVATHLIEQFLGLEEGGRDEEGELLDTVAAPAHAAAARIAEWIGSRPPLPPERGASILERVRIRQQAVGYAGSYQEWLRRVGTARAQ